MRWCWLALLASCAMPQETGELPALDVAEYRAHVHPIVRLSCASLECHGVDGRPLRLYAEDGLRASAALRGTDLTRAEARENALAFAAVDPEPETVDRHVALTKPLHLDAGGLYHQGEDLWPDTNDPAYVCLRAWLAGAPVPAIECERAAQALDNAP